MKAEQISVFLENRAGRLAEVTRSLREAGINIRALSLADTSDFGILRLIVSEPEKAKEILKDRGFTLGRTSVVAVQVNDQPGGLDSILELVSENGINVEYMYAFVHSQTSNKSKPDVVVNLVNVITRPDITLAYPVMINEYF